MFFPYYGDLPLDLDYDGEKVSLDQVRVDYKDGRLTIVVNSSDHN